jgi:hypothetical protein
MDGTEDDSLWEDCDAVPSFSSEEEKSSNVYQTWMDLCNTTFSSL